LIVLKKDGNMAKFYHYVDGNDIKTKFGIKVFVETGTADGLQFNDYIRFGYDDYYSCEINTEQYEIAVRNVNHLPNVHIFNQYSVEFLTNLLPKIKDIPTVFWLDAHLPGSEIGLPLDYEKDDKLRMPLEDEITLIKQLKNINNDIIICDDLRHYIDGNFGSGNWDLRPILGGNNIEFIYKNFQDTHNIQLNYEYGGCLILTPIK